MQNDLATLIFDRLATIERRLDKLEGRTVPLQQPQQKVVKLSTFVLPGLEEVFWHYVPTFQHMEKILNEVAQMIPNKKRPRKRIDIYAEFASGRPDMKVHASQFSNSFTIMMFIIPPKSQVQPDFAKSQRMFDDQIVISLDGSFTHIDAGVSGAEIRKLSSLLL